jgi:hypothetical protein
MNTSALKTELEEVLKITKWNLTDEQLQEIAVKLSKLDDSHKISDISNAVLSVVDSFECISLEGIDTTDTTTLLALAIEATKKS